MIRATIIAGSPPDAYSFGQYDFAALPAKGDTIVVHGAHDAEVVRVVHTEHFPAAANPRLDLGDHAEHTVTIFVSWVESARD